VPTALKSGDPGAERTERPDDWALRPKNGAWRSRTSRKHSRRSYGDFLQRPDVPLAALGIVIGVATCFPFFHGWLLLLDWVRGPYTQVISPAMFGLSTNLNDGLPFAIVADSVVRVLGAPGSWIIPVLFFPVSAVTIGRFVGGSLLGRLAAALLYCVNPFVFERLYAGQIGILVGYSLLPCAIASFRRTVEGRPPWAAALWAGGLVAITPHFAWILAVAAAALVATSSRRLRALYSMVAAAIGASALSLYVIVSAIAVHPLATGISSQLTQYRTSGDARLGLYFNVAGLYGFWRAGPHEPKNVISAWPLFLLVILVVVGIGFVAAWNAGRTQRRLGAALLASAVIAYFLALGTEGPTGALFRLAVRYVPTFVVMREPEKFSCLLAFTYAVGFGWGVRWIAKLDSTAWWQAVSAFVALALPLVYTPSLFDGLGGQVSASVLPASWSQSEKIIGSQRTVFYPWHSYMPVPAAGGRVVASPGHAFIGPTVLTSQDPGIGYQFSLPSLEDRFVAALAVEGYDTRHAGELLGELGIRFVVLAKYGAWQSYGWLSHQDDLRRVLDEPGLEVWENTAPEAPVREVAHLATIHTDLGLLDEARLLDGEGVVNGKAGILGSPGNSPFHLRADQVAVATSSTSWQIRTHERGWIVFPLPYTKGWELDGHPVRPLATGNFAAWTNGKGGQLVFEPWEGIRLGDLASLVALAAIIALRAFQRRRAS
jgi:hypothetical protein